MDCVTSSPTIDVAVSTSDEAARAVYEVTRLCTSHRLEGDDAQAATAVVRQWAEQLAAASGGAIHLRVLTGKPRGIEVVATHRDTIQLTMPSSLPSPVRSDQWTGLQGGAAMVRVGPASPSVDARFGVAQHIYQKGDFCGDAWVVAVGLTGVTALVLDGLGHGPIASIAASTGVEAFLAGPDQPIAGKAQTIHTAMARTCGGVGAIGAFDALNQRLDFVGVGDVSGRLIAPDGTTRGLASHPGILGVRQPPLRVLPYRAEGNLLVLHSDGVRDRWRLRDYPGLQQRHPALIAALLHRDFCRITDDGTILVVDLGGFEIQDTGDLGAFFYRGDHYLA